MTGIIQAIQDSDPALSPSEIERQIFVKGRKRGLGGSDIGPILGISKFRTPYDVWADKLGIGEEYKDNPRMEWGRRLEDVIAQAYAEKHPEFEVNRAKGFASMPGEPWAIANIDRLVSDGSVLEIKNVDKFAMKEWGDTDTDEIPMSYLAQVAWYMMIHNATHGTLAALFGGNDYREYRIQRDPELEAALLARGKAFWFDFVLADLPPPPISPDDAAKIWPQHDPGSVVDVTGNDSIIEIVADYRRLNDEIKAAEVTKKDLQVKIQATMGTCELMMAYDKKLLSWKTQGRTDLDRDGLKAAHPDLYEKFSKKSTVRVMR